MDVLTGRSLGTEIRLALASNFPIDPTGVLCHEFTVQLGKVALCAASLSYHICHTC